jgi:hypothetical protein
MCKAKINLGDVTNPNASEWRGWTEQDEGTGEEHAALWPLECFYKWIKNNSEQFTPVLNKDVAPTSFITKGGIPKESKVKKLVAPSVSSNIPFIRAKKAAATAATPSPIPPVGSSGTTPTSLSDIAKDLERDIKEKAETTKDVQTQGIVAKEMEPEIDFEKCVIKINGRVATPTESKIISHKDFFKTRSDIQLRIDGFSANKMGIFTAQEVCEIDVKSNYQGILAALAKEEQERLQKEGNNNNSNQKQQQSDPLYILPPPVPLTEEQIKQKEYMKQAAGNLVR